jgi:hypothetical protein
VDKQNSSANPRPGLGLGVLDQLGPTPLFSNFDRRTLAAHLARAAWVQRAQATALRSTSNEVVVHLPLDLRTTC